MMRASVFVFLLAWVQTAHAQEPSDLDMSADLRLREESNFRDPAIDTFHRGRVRARLGLGYVAAEWLRFGFRLRTGDPDDPQSPHVDFTSNFDSYAFNLDRAYMVVAPADTGLELFGGKFEHVAKSFGMLWDADVQPNGLGLVYDVKVSETVTSVRTSAFYYVLDNPAGGRASDIVGGQLLAGLQLGDDVTLTAATAVYSFDDIDSLAAESGNNTIDNTGLLPVFVEDFLISDTFVDLRAKTPAGPLQLAFDIAINVAANDNELGVHAVIALGEMKDPKDWRVLYAFSDVQSDAVVSALAQDDFRLSSGYRGHQFHVGVQLSDSVGLTAKAYLFQQDVGSQRVQVRSRLDLEAEF